MSGDVTRVPVLIVLAAGRGERMGGPKALMRVGPGRGGAEPWWKAQSRRIADAGFAPRQVIWVVSQTVADGIGDDPSGGGVERAVAVDSRAPMFASVIAGVREAGRAERGAFPSGVYVLPVDVPAPSARVFESLRAHEVGIPRYGSAHGHPVWLEWGFVERVLLPRADDAGARLDEIIRPFAVEVSTDDASVVTNLNTPRDVEDWASRS
ncbi:MAG: NTP transferase domain-containing protein [Phycisphaeraceae bacterium]|nr:NTP transferase domain-containing protein [Phycisphaeraceae bacterium]